MIIVGLLLAPAIAAPLVKLIRPEYRMFVPGRAVVFLLVTIIVGPLLAANMGLKEYWARPRPRDVIAFGGTEKFLPWWDPRGACPANCSFIAGEPAGAFWTIAPAALAPPQWRAVAYAGALAFGTTVGVMRLSFGGHFFTDVVFAGTVMFVIIWLVHGFIYRWPRTRFSDDVVEKGLERLGFALRRPFRGSPRMDAGPQS
jgi:membrane-associated PAP2 superfamily phosphatase